MILFANNLSGALMAAGILILIWIMLRRTHLRRRKSKKASAASHIPTESAVTAGSNSGQLDRFDVAMHETARDLFGQLDTKMIATQLLIGQAREQQEKQEALSAELDAKIKRLEELNRSDTEKQ